MLRSNRARKQWLALAVLALPSTPASTEQLASASLLVDGLFGATIFSDRQTVTEVGENIAAASVLPDIQYISVGASASAQPGTLRAYARADSNVPNDNEDFLQTRGAGGTARWTTDAVLAIPGVAPGTPGLATASLLFLGGISYDDQGSIATYRGTGRVGQIFRVGGVQRAVTYDGRYQWENGDGFFRITRLAPGENDTNVVYTDPARRSAGYGINEVLEVEFPFVTGQPVSIYADLTARADSLARSPGAGLDWTSNAGNSSYWLGLSGVTVGGGAVEDFSFLDVETGADLALATPVPIPGAFALFVSGCLVLAGRSSRRVRSD